MHSPNDSRIKPLKGIILPEDSPIYSIPIVLHHLLSVDAVKVVFSLVQFIAVGTVLRRAEYADVNISIVYRWQFDLAKQVQTIGRHRYSDRLEIVGRECNKITVIDVFDGAEVLNLMFYYDQQSLESRV